MEGQKERDAKEGICDLVRELAAPANKESFKVAVCRFADDAEVVVPLMGAAEAARKVSTLKLCGGQPFSLKTLFSGAWFGNGTNITAGLEAAEHVLTRSTGAADGVQEAAPLVLLFSDGCHNTGPEPTRVADRLKAAGTTLVTIAYGADADEDLLRQLASSPQHFFRCATGRDLRALFVAVGATMSASLARGVDPRDALGRLTQ